MKREVRRARFCQDNWWQCIKKALIEHNLRVSLCNVSPRVLANVFRKGIRPVPIRVASP